MELHLPLIFLLFKYPDAFKTLAIFYFKKQHVFYHIYFSNAQVLIT